MRVAIDAHTIRGRFGGNETYAVNLSTALAEEFPDDEWVLYVSRSSAAETARGLHQRLRPVKTMPGPRLLRITCSLPWRTWRDKIDLLHVQYFQPPLPSCPIVNVIHDISFEHLPQFFTTYEVAYMRTLLPLLANRADALITVSEFSKSDIAGRYNIDPQRIHVVNPAHSPACRPIEDANFLENTRKRLNLPERFLLFVSNIQPRKNLRGVLAALALLEETDDDLGLVVVGQRKTLGSPDVDYVSSMGLERKVRFMGHLDDEDLIVMYNLASVFVYPSFFEGFGLPPLEAMACGTPVVTSNVTALPEAVGDAALLVDPYDTEAIADAIRSIVDDSSLARELREKGLARAKLFSWQRAARETHKVYLEVLDKRRAQ